MYPTSAPYKEKIIERNPPLRVVLQIQHSEGTLNLTDANLFTKDALEFTEASQSGQDFSVGGVVSSTLNFDIKNKSEYAALYLVGATVTCSIGLEVSDPPVPDPEDPDPEPYVPVYEYVPLGIFNVDEVLGTKASRSLTLKCVDNLILFDKPYPLSSLVYPATLSQIFLDLCSVCDVLPHTLTFPNSAYSVTTRPDDDLTCRDMLGYVAELAGCFARARRDGKIELAWYADSGLEVTGANRYDFTPRDDVIQISGVTATVGSGDDAVTYLAGTDTYAIDLSDNPLLQDDIEDCLDAVLAAVEDVPFHAFESSWQGNPAVQAGDIITQVDRDSNEYPTLVTHSTYKYRGKSHLAARGLPVVARGFKGSTNRKIAQVIRKVEAAMGDRLTSIEQATLHMTELIANMLGGHVIAGEDALYIADTDDLETATKIWKWGLGGFGYSDDGGETYTTGITNDGTIVAMLVAAGIVTADMIVAGVLQSSTGSTSINLDNGRVNIQNKVYFDPVAGEYVFKGLLHADTIQALKGQFDVTVSYTTITQVLAAEKGNISELTVDQLDTSDMVQRYLDSNKGNVNYIKVEGQNIELIEAVVKEGAPTPTAQLIDRKQRPLYWLDATHEGVTTQETLYPVMVYQYHIENKRKMILGFATDPITGNAIPSITLGAGDENQRQKGYIIKDEHGLLFRYETAAGDWHELRIGDNGIEGTNAALTGLDFYSDGMISEYDDGSAYDWSWEKDGSGRITEITNNTTGKSATITWNAGAKP